MPRGIPIFLLAMQDNLIRFFTFILILILEVDSENRCARMERSWPFIWLRHLFRSRAVTNRNFFFRKKRAFFFTCATCSAYPFYKKYQDLIRFLAFIRIMCQLVESEIVNLISSRQMIRYKCKDLLPLCKQQSKVVG